MNEAQGERGHRKLQGDETVDEFRIASGQINFVSFSVACAASP